MKSFACSLCHKGILGGVLYLDKQSLTYRTNKLTVDRKIVFNKSRFVKWFQEYSQ